MSRNHNCGKNSLVSAPTENERALLDCGSDTVPSVVTEARLPAHQVLANDLEALTFAVE